MRLEQIIFDHGRWLGIRVVRTNRAVRISREVETFKLYRFRRRLSVQRLAAAKLKLRKYAAKRFTARR